MLETTETVPARDDLLAAAALGARLEARHLRAAGLDAGAAREQVLDRYRAVLADAGYEAPAGAALMAAVRGGLDEVLAPRPAR